MPETQTPPEGREPRPPSLLDALLPVVVLILLIALTIILFGVSATDGPLQVALLLSAAFASLIAFKNGYTAAAVADAAVGGVSTALGAVFILLAVGALIGTWNMAGTIPTVVDYGIRLLNPSIFYLATAAICAIVGVVTGSSWTTAGTLGVAPPTDLLARGVHRSQGSSVPGDSRLGLVRGDPRVLHAVEPGARLRRR